MADELIDIYDEHNEPTGMQEMKSVAHRDGLWHRAAHVWMYTKKGEILLQLRSMDKELHPGKWDISVGGHIGAREDVDRAALREIKEEIGMEVSMEQLSYWKTVKKSSKHTYHNNEFDYVYFFLLREDQEFNFNDGEVTDVRLIHVDKLEEEIKSDNEDYVPHGQYWFDVIEEVRKRIS